jgi:hypothetical protein
MHFVGHQLKQKLLSYSTVQNPFNTKYLPDEKNDAGLNGIRLRSKKVREVVTGEFLGFFHVSALQLPEDGEVWYRFFVERGHFLYHVTGFFELALLDEPARALRDETAGNDEVKIQNLFQ